MFKAIRKFFSRRFNRFYRQKRRRLILDIILLWRLACQSLLLVCNLSSELILPLVF